MVVTVLGFMAFQSSAFYLAYFMQEVREWSAIEIAVHLLPQAIAGMIWNVLIGHILHKVNNTLLMAAGALSYLAANLLLSLMSSGSNYWAFMFPALVLNVVGADFQFNVANVSHHRHTLSIQSLPPLLFFFLYRCNNSFYTQDFRTNTLSFPPSSRCTSCSHSHTKHRDSPAAS